MMPRRSVHRALFVAVVASYACGCCQKHRPPSHAESPCAAEPQSEFLSARVLLASGGGAPEARMMAARELRDHGSALDAELLCHALTREAFRVDAVVPMAEGLGVCRDTTAYDALYWACRIHAGKRVLLAMRDGFEANNSCFALQASAWFAELVWYRFSEGEDRELAMTKWIDGNYPYLVWTSDNHGARLHLTVDEAAKAAGIPIDEYTGLAVETRETADPVGSSK